MRIAEISIKRPVFTTVIIIALLVFGIISYTGLTINDMPEADIPYVTVTVIQPGASPQELETKVTKQIEEAVGQISGVKHIMSMATDNVTNVVVEFGLDTPSDVAAQEVRDKVGSVRGQLPQDIQEPVIAKFDISAQAVVSVAVTGKDNSELSALVDDVIVKRLNAVKGVGAVNTYGNDEREIQIKLDKDKLASYGVTTTEVINSLKSDNIDMPGGKVTDGNREITLKASSSVKKVEEFNDILVTKRDGTEIRIRDIAKVVDGTKEKDSLSFYQGKQAIGIDIIKQSGANTVELADGINEEIEKIKADLPEGVSIDVIRDNSVAIRDMVNDVIKTMIEGAILAVVIVYLFLNNGPSTIISATSLPICIITTFACMKLMNFSLNGMSLMALSLAVGMLIDDAIVVIENIVRHLKMGSSPIKAARDGTAEIGFAVIATTLAVICVFLPIALVEGIIGKFFIEFALSIVFSMAVSMFVSFTLVPMMASKMLKDDEHEKKARTPLGKFVTWFNKVFDSFAEKYSKFLGTVLNHRFITMAIAIIMFVGSIGLVPILGFDFMPAADLGEINISADLDSGLTLEAAGQKAKDIEEVAKKHKEVTYIYSTIEKNKVSTFVKLVDKNERKDGVNAIIDKMRTELSEIPGVELSVSSASSMGGSSKDVSFNITGDDNEKIQAFALEAKELMSKDPHARDVSTNYKAGKPEVKLEIDRNKAADLGVNTVGAASALNTLFNGTEVGKFDSGHDRYDVRLSIEDEQRQDLDALNGIYVMSSNGQMVSLDRITKKGFATTASTLNRYDRMGQVEISANVSGMAVGDFLNLYIDKFQNEMQVPEGVSVTTGGSNASMQEGVDSLIIALFMAVLLLYLVMAAQFESFIDPISIMFALPLALIGAIVGLLVAGDALSIVALIGVIMLMGLVAKNGILLIDAAKQRMEEGMEVKEALKEAGLVRLRPIIMTTLAMILGMIPLAIATGASTESRSPMAHAVIGGLISSTILTLFVVPVVYTLLDDIKVFFRKIFSSKSVEKIN